MDPLYTREQLGDWIDMACYSHIDTERELGSQRLIQAAEEARDMPERGAVVCAFVVEQFVAKSFQAGRPLRTLFQMVLILGSAVSGCAAALVALFRKDEQRTDHRLLPQALIAIGAEAGEQLMADVRRPQVRESVRFRAYLDVLSEFEGDEIDVFFSELITSSHVVSLQMHACRLLRCRSGRAVLSSLLGWLAAQEEEESRGQEWQVIQEVIRVVGSFGDVSTGAIPQIASWLAHEKPGCRLAALEALGAIGVPESVVLLRPYLLGEGVSHDPRRRPLWRQQKAAAKGLCHSADATLLDDIVQIFLEERTYGEAWTAVADAIVAIVTRGMAPGDGFAWLRTLLEGEPGPRMWYLLCRLVNEWHEDERAMVIDYVQGHISHWDDGLRLLKVEYNSFRQPDPQQEILWPKAPKGDLMPAWSLVRTMVCVLPEYHRDAKLYAAALKKNPNPQLMHLSFTNFLLREGHAALLAEASLQNVKTLHFEDCVGTLEGLERHLFNAPWLASLESLVFANFSYGYADAQQHQKPNAPYTEKEYHKIRKGLTRDPRVERFQLSLPK